MTKYILAVVLGFTLGIIFYKMVLEKPCETVHIGKIKRGATVDIEEIKNKK